MASPKCPLQKPVPDLTNIFSWFRYNKVTERGLMSVSSSNLKVGDIIVVEKGVRVPADLVLLR